MFSFIERNFVTYIIYNIFLYLNNGKNKYLFLYLLLMHIQYLLKASFARSYLFNNISIVLLHFLYVKILQLV